MRERGIERKKLKGREGVGDWEGERDCERNGSERDTVGERD